MAIAEQVSLGDTPSLSRGRRALGVIGVLFFFLIMLGWYDLAGRVVDWSTADDIDRFVLRARDSVDQIATNLARNLQDDVRRLGNLPEVLTDDVLLRAPLLNDRADPATRAAAVLAANIRLHQLALQLEVDIVYVLDAQGRCVAASNYQTSDSVVGVDLHARQYFAAIENGGRGRQFAFGNGSGIPGVYFSSAIRKDSQFKGGVVVKRSIRSLFRLTTRNAAMLVDEYGVVVAGNSEQAMWHYLPDSAAVGLGGDFLQDRYHQAALQPIALHADAARSAVSLVHLFNDPVPSLMTTRPIGDSGLRLIYFTPLPDLGAMRDRAKLGFWLVFLCGGLILTLLSSALLMVLQTRWRVTQMRFSFQKLSALSRELAAEKDAAQAADRAKSRFLATMSHELRTPFTGILGVVDLLRASPLPRAAMQQVGLLERSARSLLGLLNDILDFSLIDAGKLRVDKVPFDLGVVIDDLGEIHRAVASAKGISLTVSRPDNPLIGLGDPNRLRQILNNFLSNAIKFTVLGGAKMIVSIAGEGEMRRLTVTVSDSGPGMSAETQRHLFEPFFQADAETTRKHGGAGLGLAIARHIAQAMGGEVGVHSEVGHGASFWLEIPFAETSLAPVNRESPAVPNSWQADAGGSRRILLADDDEVNRLVISAILRQAGHQVTLVQDGRQAVRDVGKADYDLVILDMQMPDMDGVQAARAVRAMSQAKSQIPILGLTADVIEENRAHYVAAGLTDLINKPIDAAVLLAAVRKHADRVLMN